MREIRIQNFEQSLIEQMEQYNTLGIAAKMKFNENRAKKPAATGKSAAFFFEIQRPS